MSLDKLLSSNNARFYVPVSLRNFSEEDPTLVLDPSILITSKKARRCIWRRSPGFASLSLNKPSRSNSSNNGFSIVRGIIENEVDDEVDDVLVS